MLGRHSHVTALLTVLVWLLAVAVTRAQDTPADFIVHNAKVTTQDNAQPDAEAFAVRDGIFVRVGAEGEVMRLKGDRTRVVNAAGRRVIPGLNDSHLHVVRGGRFYNLVVMPISSSLHNPPDRHGPRRRYPRRS